MKTQKKECPDCRGTGYIDHESAGQVRSVPCPECSGTGDLRCGDKSWFTAEQHRKRLSLISKSPKPPIKDYRMTAEITDFELEKMVAKRVLDPYRVFRYADALRVIEHMRKLNFVVRLDNGLDGTWEATFYKPAEAAHGPNDQYYAPESTFARAICVSALKAVHAPEIYEAKSK